MTQSFYPVVPFSLLPATFEEQSLETAVRFQVEDGVIRSIYIAKPFPDS